MISASTLIWLLGSGSKPLGLDVEEMTSILAVQTSEERHDPSRDTSRRPGNHVVAVISLPNETTDELERVSVVSRLSRLDGPSASRSCKRFKSQTMSSTGAHNTTLPNLVNSDRITSKRVESLKVDGGPGVHSPFNRSTFVYTDAGLGSTDILSSGICILVSLPEERVRASGIEQDGLSESDGFISDESDEVAFLIKQLADMSVYGTLSFVKSDTLCSMGHLKKIDTLRNGDPVVKYLYTC